MAIPGKPKEQQLNISIDELQHKQLHELIAQETSKSLPTLTPKVENAKKIQLPLKEITYTSPQIIESVDNLCAQKYDKNTIEYEFEVNKSYITSECSPTETTDNICKQEKAPKIAEKQLTEMKSIEQIEVVLGEKTQALDVLVKEGAQNALVNRTTFQEVTNIKQDTLENITEIPESSKPENSLAKFDLETHKSYLVLENTIHEDSQNINTQFCTLPKKATEEILGVMPVELTEIVMGEVESVLNSTKGIPEENITSNAVALEPISQMNIHVQESVIDKSFEKLLKGETASCSLNETEGLKVYEVVQGETQETLIPGLHKSVTAERNLTTMTHLQYSENVSEMQAGLLNLQQTQSKTTNIKTTDMLPLTVTDTISFQTETQFKVKEPEAHKLKEIFNLSSEIEVREKILDEQIMPYNEKHPKALKTNFTISDADYENIVITQPDVHIQDKTMVKKDSPKTSDVEESEEIVTKFIQAPGNREPIQIKTKRTILRKRKTETSDTFNEGDIVIEESLDEENRSEIHQEINHNVQIEEYEGDETHLNYNNDKSTVEMPEEQFEIPKLRSQVLIEEIEEENESEESSLKKDKDFNMKTTEKIKQSQIEVINEEVQSDNLPSDKEEAPKQERTEELPEVTTKEENQSREGKPKQKKMTKRVIKTKVGPKMETSEVSTTKQDDEQPVVTIHKAKETFDDTITPFDDLVEPHEAKVVEEEPEEVKIDQVQTETGEIKKAKTVKRVIKKRKESKQEVTEITTVEKEGEEPVTTVLVTEEEMPENVQALELPVETTIEELPSEEGKPKQKKITKRVIKKKVGPKLETTLIITTQQDDEQPVVTIHKTEETFDNTTTPFDDSVETHKAKVVEEEPEEVKIDQVQTATGEIKKVKTVKRVIKKRQGPKQEVTEITTVEKEGEEPVTTISVTEEAPSDKVETPEKVHTVELPVETTIEELPSEEGKPKQKKIIKRVIKNKVGPKLETTQIITTQQDDEQPVVTIHKTEETFDDTTTPFDDLVEPHKAKVVEEEPEEVKIDQVQTETGEIKKVKTVKRVIKKRQGPKQEVTEITTVEKEGEEPVTTVVVTEEKSSDKEAAPEKVQTVELPEETTIEELPSEKGKPKQKKITKRVIKKKVGPKLETTQIITTQQDDEQPVVTIHKTEETIDDTTTPFDALVKPHKAKVVEEEPEEVKIDQVQTDTGEIKKVKTVKRVIKKRQGPKQEVTEITTVEKEGEEPVTTVLVTEEASSDKEDAPEKVQTIELPEETTIEELPSEEGKPKQKKITKRVIKKKVGPKLETTQIITTHQDDAQPVVTIHKTEGIFDDTITPFDDIVETHKAKLVEEEPEEVKIDQVQTETGELKKVKTVKRVIKKRQGTKQEVTEITTVEKEGEEPVTTVSVTEEAPSDKVETPEKVHTVELPVETTIEELPSEEGKPKQRKITKRVIKKKVGPKLETTQIITTQQDDEQPVFTIH
ncbi:unnamed protein product, partial [Parnassius mnemosyne]